MMMTSMMEKKKESKDIMNNRRIPLNQSGKYPRKTNKHKKVKNQKN